MIGRNKNKTELIRINLKKEKTVIEKLKAIDISALKEIVIANVFPILFLIGLLTLALTGGYYFYLQKKVSELKMQVEREKNRRKALLSEIKRLQREIEIVQVEARITKFVRKHNESVLKFIENPLPFRKSGFIIQNVSVCAFKEENCDIEKYKGSLTLNKVVKNVDIILMGNIEEIPFENVRRQTTIEIADLYFKRFCLEIKDEESYTTKR